MAHVFCRNLCLDKGEPLAGTGALPRRILLLHWPRGKWRSPRHLSEGLGVDLSAAIQAAQTAGIHVSCVDRQGDADGMPLLQDPGSGVISSVTTPDEAAAAIRTVIAGGELVGQSVQRLTVMCCTDSRRDACCAKFGFATFKALKAAADPDRFQILQCTHIGGCRFAASLVVLPGRARYGRLDPTQVPGFLAALDRGEAYLPALRGRAALSEPEQAAEIAVLEWAEARGVVWSAVALAAASGTGHPRDMEYEARIGPHRLRVVLRAEPYFTQGNCSAVADGGGKDVLRWRVIATEPAL